jgi:hypothetical protein
MWFYQRQFLPIFLRLLDLMSRSKSASKYWISQFHNDKPSTKNGMKNSPANVKPIARRRTEQFVTGKKVSRDWRENQHDVSSSEPVQNLWRHRDQTRMQPTVLNSYAKCNQAKGYSSAAQDESWSLRDTTSLDLHSR